VVLPVGGLLLLLLVHLRLAWAACMLTQLHAQRAVLLSTLEPCCIRI
jgi:hypothetical protein